MMTELTLTVRLPDELALRVQEARDRLPEVLELGLRELTSPASRVYGDVLDFLGRGARPEEIIAFRPSPTQQARVQALLERSRAGTLSEAEDSELDQYERLEHVMILLKARARKALSVGA